MIEGGADWGEDFVDLFHSRRVMTSFACFLEKRRFVIFQLKNLLEINNIFFLKLNHYYVIKVLV